MTVSQPANQPFVPAWKRLGLKLKNNPTLTEDGNNNSLTNGNVVPVKSKKRKASGNIPSDPSRIRSEDDDSPSLKRKKSVKFADDSKDTDGDENSNLFQDYVAQQAGGEDQFSKAEIAQFVPTKVHPANEPLTTANSKPSQNGSGSKKKSKKDRKVEKPQETPSYVTYLEQFHTSHNTWKFHKAHQIALLKNLYNTYRIPFEQDEALSSYLAGLQSEATRKRLTDEARKVYLETDDVKDSMPGKTVHEAAKENALKRQLKATKGIMRNQEAAESAYSDEHQEKLRKRRRAQLVLQSLLRREPPSPALANGKEEVRPADERPVKKRRSRRSKKMRTGHPDDDDTDETSSVDSVPSFTERPSDDEGKDEGSEDSGSNSSSVVSSDSSDTSSGSEDESESEDDSESD